MVERKALSQSAAKEVLAELTRSGGEPQAIVEQKGLAPIADSGELESIVQRAIEADPGAVEQIRAGKDRAVGAHHRRGHEGDEGAGRRRRGDAASCARSSGCRRPGPGPRS